MGFLRVAYSDVSPSLAFPRHRLVLPHLPLRLHGSSARTAVFARDFSSNLMSVLAPLLQNEAILWQEGVLLASEHNVVYCKLNVSCSIG